jgi:hypothetical protein
MGLCISIPLGTFHGFSFLYISFLVVTVELPTSTDTNKTNNNNNFSDDANDDTNDVFETNNGSDVGKLGNVESSRRSCSSRSTCNWDVCSYEATSKSCCSSMASASSRSSINSDVFGAIRFVDASVQCEAGSIDRTMNR